MDSEIILKNEEEEGLSPVSWQSLISPSETDELRQRIKTSESGRIYNILETLMNDLDNLCKLTFIRENRVYIDKSSIDQDLRDAMSEFYALERRTSCLMDQDELPDRIPTVNNKGITSVLRKCHGIKWENLVIDKPNKVTDRTGTIKHINDMKCLWSSNLLELMDHLEKTPEEVSQENRMHKEHIKENIRNEKILKKLKEENKNLLNIKEQEINKKTVLVNKINEKIKLIDSFYKDLIEKKESSMEFEMHSLMENIQAMKNRNESIKERHIKDLENIKAKNLKIEGELRHQRLKIILDTDSTIKKYDEEMFEKTRLYEEIEANLKKKSREKEKAEFKVQKIAEDYYIVETELGYQQEREVKREQTDAHMAVAIVKLQAWWRGTLHRLRLGLFLPGQTRWGGRKVELSKIKPKAFLQKFSGSISDN